MHVGIVWQACFPWNRGVGRLAETLHHQGHEVTILAQSVDRTQPWHYGRLVPFLWAGRSLMHAILSSHMPFNILWMFWILYCVKRYRIRLLIVRELPLALMAYGAARLAHIPVLMDMRENYPAAVKVWGMRRPWHLLTRNATLVALLERMVVPHMDHVFVVVEEQKKRLQDMGLPSQNITVNMNTPPDAFVQRSVQLSAQPLPPHQRFVFLYCGAVTRHRGLETVIRAIPAVIQHGYTIVVRFVGEGPDLPRLKQLVSDLGVTDYVQWDLFFPPDTVPDIIHDCDAGIVNHLRSAHTETTIPNKLFEYMVAQKPVIASAVGPIRRIVEEEQCGLVVEPTDVDAMAQAMRTLCTLPHECRRMGLRGQQAVVTRYQWTVTSRDLQTIIARYATADRAHTKGYNL